MSVSLFVCPVPYQNSTKWYLQFWIRYPTKFFWRYSWDVGTLVQNNFEFYVCLSVHLFAYFLAKIRQRDISSSGWDIFMDSLETFLRCCYKGSKQFWIFCMSFSLVVGILPQRNLTNLGIPPALYYVSFWIFMDTFLGYWYTCSK